MHVYNNLNDEVKRIFRYRVAYILCLILWTLYCATILTIGYTTIFLIAIVVINCIMILNSAIHIWNLIDTNSLTYYTSNCNLIQFTDLVVGGSGTGAAVAIYCFALWAKYEFMIYEFIGMLPYIVVYSSVFAYVILLGLYMFLMYCYMRVIQTKGTVEERQRLVDVKISD